MSDQPQQVPLDIRPLTQTDKDRAFVEYQLYCETSLAQIGSGLQVPSALLFADMPSAPVDRPGWCIMSDT